MTLTILSDENIKAVLQDLTRADLEELQKTMRDALHEYATGTTNSGACAENQPNRTVLESNNGTTTLFMPSTSSAGLGIKVVTLAAPSIKKPEIPPDGSVPLSTDTTPQGSLTLMTSDGKPYGFVNAEEVTAFRTALASSLLIARRNKVKTLTVFGTGKQAYWHVRLSLLLKGHTIRKVHFINRDFTKRAAMIMTAFVSFDGVKKFQEGWSDCTFDVTSLKYVEVERILKDQVRAADVIICTTPSTEPLFDHTILTNNEGRKRARLIVAIGSYKPHMIEIPPEVLTQAIKTHGHGHHFHKRAEEGGAIIVDTLSCLKEAGELVQAGVTSMQTVELGELVMLEHREADQESVESPVDDDEPTSNSSLSLQSLNMSPDADSSASRSLAGVFGGKENRFLRGGDSTPTSPTRDLSRSRNSSFSRSRKGSRDFRSRSTSVSSTGRRKRLQTEKEDRMSRWLSSGNVIYKSVGMGLMDLVVGGDIVRLAREKGVGITMEDF